RHSNIPFKGYAAGHKPSEVSGLPRLYYDRSRPYERQIPFYNYAEPGNFVQKPDAYIIPQGWWPVLDRLKHNQVAMQRLPHDTTLVVEVYHIEDYQTTARPYEGHYLHSQVKVTATKDS